jgi:predicted RNase H-like HicB family nuclease
MSRVYIEPDTEATGYVAYNIDLPGLETYGWTAEEAYKNMRYAVVQHLSRGTESPFYRKSP